MPSGSPVVLDVSVQLAGVGVSVVADCEEVAYVLVGGLNVSVAQSAVQVRV
jgi:hypothetical protein